jgi:hypothetical protein
MDLLASWVTPGRFESRRFRSSIKIIAHTRQKVNRREFSAHAARFPPPPAGLGYSTAPFGSSMMFIKLL